MGKGASTQQTTIANNQEGFMNTLQQDYGTAFSGQKNILAGLEKAQQAVLAGGPSQFGFSVPQTTALNTMATSANAAAYQSTKAQIGEGEAGAGGGNTYLPTGSSGESLATAAASSAQNLASSKNKIQEAGYSQGSQNYNNAVSGLLSDAKEEDPSGIASEANKASDTAFSESTEVNNMNASNSIWPSVGGLAGSLIGQYFGGPIGGQVGGAVGTTLGSINGSTPGTYTSSEGEG